MSKFRRTLSVLTSTAIAASTFTSLAISSRAYEASISYADGKATATASGKLIATRYDENGLLTYVKMYDAVADTPVDVEVSEGDKLMLWDGVDGETMKPLTGVYTVEAPVEPTATPGSGTLQTYLEDNFDSYTTTGTAAQGKEAQQAALGDLILYVGARGGGGDGKTGVSIEDGALKIVSEKYATSSRGVSFAVNAEKVAIPAFSEIEEGTAISYGFKAKFTNNDSTIQMMGVTDNTTTLGGQVVNDPYLSIANNSHIPVNEWVNVSVEVDNQKNGFIVIKDADGKLVSTASFTAVGDSLQKFAFYGGATTVYFDDISIKKVNKENGKLETVVKDDNGDGIEGVSVTVDRFTVTTDSDGKAAFVLPNGTYNVVASKPGYEHTKGVQDNDTKSVTINSDTQTADFLLNLMSYDKIPETVNIENGNAFIAAPKTGDVSLTAPFTVSVLDQVGLPVTDSSEYTLTWAIYPAGTTTADGLVSINGEGVVSVSKDFSSANDISEYDVTATVVMNNAGLRGQTVSKTLLVGNNDVTYYENINWNVAGGSRSESKNLAQDLSLGDTSSVTVTLNFGSFGNYSDNGRTFVLVSPEGKVAGVQLLSADRSIKAFTGYNGTAAMNQYGDNGNFTNSAILVPEYTYGQDIDVTFVIDRVSKNVTVSCGEVTVPLPLTVIPSAIRGFATGLYRYNCAFSLSKLLVKEPDNNYLSISGDVDFAKVSGQTIERTYTLGQSVIVPDETFTWMVSPADQGVTVENGVLSVADSAIPGTYALTATSDINEDKTATVNVEIGDFQTITADNATIKGPHALADIGHTDVYSITRLVDSYGDDVTALLPAADWSSSNTDVATIDAATGELTTTGYGKTTITATITNGTAVTTLSVPVTVAQYYITADVTSDSTAVDTSSLVTDSAITGYQVTTSKNGEMVKQEVVETAPTTIDTSGADKLEIAPVFTYTDITPYSTKTADIPADTYNFVISGASGTHFDPYVNDQMLANNMLQGGSAITSIAVNDIVVSEGYAKLNLRDYASNSKAGKITMVKSPSIVDRVKKVYVLGDSLVCIYANGGDKDHNYQTGFGQVLQNYLTDEYEVVDLGNSGVTAEGLAASAITQVAASGKPGDVMILESGYNDRSYSTTDKMKAAVKAMYSQANESGVYTILVSPPASAHDYKADVVWTNVMKQAADETRATYFDLAAASYKFFNDTYADSFSDASVYSVYNVSDRLHSTFNGANKIASIMAGGMIDLGLGAMVNTEYVYTFKDALGNTIVCQATATLPE